MIRRRHLMVVALAAMLTVAACGGDGGGGDRDDAQPPSTSPSPAGPRDLRPEDLETFCTPLTRDGLDDPARAYAGRAFTGWQSLAEDPEARAWLVHLFEQSLDAAPDSLRGPVATLRAAVVENLEVGDRGELDDADVRAAMDEINAWVIEHCPMPGAAAGS